MVEQPVVIQLQGPDHLDGIHTTILCDGSFPFPSFTYFENFSRRGNWYLAVVMWCDELDHQILLLFFMFSCTTKSFWILIGAIKTLINYYLKYCQALLKSNTLLLCPFSISHSLLFEACRVRIRNLVAVLDHLSLTTVKILFNFNVHLMLLIIVWYRVCGLSQPSRHYWTVHIQLILVH
jgi:hypothetical protein